MKQTAAMPMHPVAEAILARSREAGYRMPHEQTVEEARETQRLMVSLAPPGPEVADVRNVTVAGAAGELPARVYEPFDDAPSVVVFFHGGGYTICDLDTHDDLCRRICLAFGATVVSVEYRLAPEHRFPAAVDDCLAATKAIAADVAGGRPIVLAGDSAGANISTVTCLRIRDEGGPAIAAQVLLYPALAGYGDTTSMRDNGEGCGMTAADVAWFWANYVGDDHVDERPPLAAPLHHPDVSRLPPAFVMTAEYDVLRDEGQEYARRLRDAGVEVEELFMPGLIHAFLQLPAFFAPEIDEVVAAATTFVKKHTRTTTP